MKTYEASAKTTEEAIDAGLAALGVSISDVTVQVIDEGSKGLFGLFGSRLAKVRLTVKETEEDPLSLLMADKPAPKAEKKADRKAEAKPDKKAEEKSDAEKPARPPRQPKPRQPKAEKAEKQEKPEQPEQEKKPLPPKAPAKPIEKPVVTMIPAEEVVADSAAGKAQTFLKELTRLMGVDVDVAVGNDTEGNVFVQMTGDTLGILIGRRGETLDALQYLTSLKINRGQEGYTRITLDTENYRAKREDTLIRLANRMANRAVKTGRKVSLEPMNPYERRIIHSALQANEAVDTHSEGDEPNRHVVITLRK